jgi:hypothetical protein
MSDPLSLIRAHQPKFHGATPDQRTHTWGISERVLEYMYDALPAGGTTLETGCGYSTLVFLGRSSRHIAIAPDAAEQQAIELFCKDNGIDIGPLEFHAARSQDVWPGLQLPALDAVLIDGGHGFPVPFMDWYYTADAIRSGGLLLVDDVQLPTGKVLREFLLQEPEWRHVQDLGKTAIFEKLVEGDVTSKGHNRQPWAARKYPEPGADLRTRVKFLRNNVRLRTRLRHALKRTRT